MAMISLSRSSQRWTSRLGPTPSHTPPDAVGEGNRNPVVSQISLGHGRRCLGWARLQGREDCTTLPSLFPLLDYPAKRSPILITPLGAVLWKETGCNVRVPLAHWSPNCVEHA